MPGPDSIDADRPVPPRSYRPIVEAIQIAVGLITFAIAFGLAILL